MIDAYAWIELFIGSTQGVKVKQLLEEAEEIYTPGTVLAEIARKYSREGVDEKTVEERLQLIISSSNVTPIDAETAIEASRSYLELAKIAKRSKTNDPSLFDALVLGTCRRLKSKVVTGDEHFRNLPETIWIGTSS